MKPDWVVQALTHNETFSGLACDPACRDYDLVTPLRRHGLLMYGSDAREKTQGTPKIDFWHPSIMTPA